jgi:hypothetical protein
MRARIKEIDIITTEEETKKPRANFAQLWSCGLKRLSEVTNEEMSLNSSTKSLRERYSFISVAAGGQISSSKSACQKHHFIWEKLYIIIIVKVVFEIVSMKA